MAKITAARIGFDLDKIFINHPPFVPYSFIEYFYKKQNNTLSYRIPGKIEQNLRIFTHGTHLRPPIQKNIEALRLIAKKKGSVLYLISGRFSFLKKKTHEWDKKHAIFKYFTKTFLNSRNEQPHLFKARIIKQEKIEKYIDDDLDLLLYLNRKNPNVEFFWITGSKTVPKLPRGIKRLKDLSELFS